MSQINHQISKYQYEFHNQFTSDGVNENGIVYLYDMDKELRAVIAFVADDRELEAPTEPLAGHMAVQMHARHLPSIIDMLRNEKPLTFSWSPANGVIRLSTQMEPVGEQELKRLFAFLYI